MKINWIQDAIKDPAKNILATILVTTFGLGLITNGLSSLILETLGTSIEKQYHLPKIWFQILLVTALASLLLTSIYLTHLAEWLKERLNPNAPKLQTANVEPLEWGYSGLVVTVSTPYNNKPTAAEDAIRFHWQRGALTHCWMICTDQSEPEARAIADRLESEGAASSIFHYGEQHVLWQGDRQDSGPMSLLLAKEAADDPNYMRRLVDRIYQEATQFGISEENLIVDYTGGTKSMTAGMILACVSPRRPMEYFSQLMNRLMLVRTAYELKAPLNRV